MSNRWRDPRTPGEWQEAVNGAQLLLHIDAMQQYELIEGGPTCNADRCRQILSWGRRRGYRPQDDVIKGALGDLLKLPEVKVNSELLEDKFDAETRRRRSLGDIAPGDRLVLTPYGVSQGTHRGRGRGWQPCLYGTFVRKVTPRDGGGAHLMLVTKAGNTTPQTYGADYWRKLPAGQTHLTGEQELQLIEDGEAMMHARAQPVPAAAEPDAPAAAEPLLYDGRHVQVPAAGRDTTGLALSMPLPEAAYNTPVSSAADFAGIRTGAELPLPPPGAVKDADSDYWLPESMAPVPALRLPRPQEKLVMLEATVEAINAHPSVKPEQRLTAADVDIYTPPDDPEQKGWATDPTAHRGITPAGCYPRITRRYCRRKETPSGWTFTPDWEAD